MREIDGTTTDSSRTRARITVALGAIAAGAVLAVLPFAHADAAPTMTRISGADRYETAAKISEASFAAGVPVAYVATGEAFPDALAGAPAAAKGGGPVLLTKKSTLPASTATELDRLNPGKIIVLGGTSAVSQSVMDSLDPYTDGTLTRISGNDRYETAANVSLATFSPGVNTVFVATGQNFPDALSGGPAVANAPGGGGPLLLVQTNSIPSSTATELDRLNAQKIVVLGGTSAVSDNVISGLDTYSTDPVVRRSGADRYLTSVAISSAAFASAPKVYLATGANFPDALAGGSPAGIAHGPVLLSQPTCITPEVDNEINRLNPDSIIVLGGESALSAAVLNRTVCAPAPANTQPTFPGGGDFCSGGSVPTFPGGSTPTFPGGGNPCAITQT